MYTHGAVKRQRSAHGSLKVLVCGHSSTRIEIAKRIELWGSKNITRKMHTRREICVLKFISIYQPISYIPFGSIYYLSIPLPFLLSLQNIVANKLIWYLFLCMISLILLKILVLIFFLVRTIDFRERTSTKWNANIDTP